MFRMIFLMVFTILSSLGCSSNANKKKIHELDTSDDFNSGIYKIFSGASSKCLTHINEMNVFNLIQKECDGGKNQLFKVTKIDEKEYSIAPVENLSSCLSISEVEPAKKILISKPACSREDLGTFSFKRSKIDPKFVNIWSKSDDRCLDLFEKSRRNGGLLHKYACSFQASQDFLFDKFDKTAEAKTLTRKIWTYWDKGASKMPAFYQANIKKWQALLETSDFAPLEIVVVNNIPDDPNYFGNFFQTTEILTSDEIDKHLSEKEKKNKLNPNVIFSDFVRLELLYNHGGIWMDPSIILHENFDDVFGAIEHISSIQIIGYSSKHQANLSLGYADSLENFYLAAIKNSAFIAEWKRNFKNYWLQKKPGMDITQHPMYNGSKDAVVDLSQYGELKNYLNQHAALKLTLTKNNGYLKNIYISGDTTSDEKGPFTLLESVGWDDRKLITTNSKLFPDILNTLKNVKMSKFPSDNSKYIRFTDGDPNRPRSFDFFEDEKNIFGLLNRLTYDDDIGIQNL